MDFGILDEDQVQMREDIFRVTRFFILVVAFSISLSRIYRCVKSFGIGSVEWGYMLLHILILLLMFTMSTITLI